MQKRYGRQASGCRSTVQLKEEIANTKHEILKWVLDIARTQTVVIDAIIGVAIELVAK